MGMAATRANQVSQKVRANLISLSILQSMDEGKVRLRVINFIMQFMDSKAIERSCFLCESEDFEK